MSGGPYENLGPEEVVTYACPRCETMHDRASYTETGRMKINGTLHRLYKCPGGHQVILKMSVTIEDKSPVYIELEPSTPEEVAEKKTPEQT